MCSSDLSEFDEEIEELTSKIESPKFHGLSYPDDKDTEVFKERDELEKELLFMEESRKETLIIECDLKNFEIGNLIRLGILTVNPKIDDKKLTINSLGHSFSDLGVLFLNACINTERPE